MNHYENLLSRTEKNFDHKTGLTNAEKNELEEAVKYIIEKCYKEADKGLGSALIEFRRTNFVTGTYYSVSVKHKKLLVSKLKDALHGNVEIYAKKYDRNTPVIFGGDDIFHVGIKWRE